MESQILEQKKVSGQELRRHIKPRLLRDMLLLAPGNWNGVNYTSEEIHKAFLNTDWSDKSNTHLYLDHKDTKGLGVGNWAGFVVNPRMAGDELRGDLEIWHPLLATFLEDAKAKFGLSATLSGIENNLSNQMENFHYESFSFVIDPACDLTYINLSKEKGKGNLKTITVSLNETKEGEIVNELEVSNTPKKLSDIRIELKGGNNNMPSETKKLEDEKVEEKPEEAKEEAVAESKPSENVEKSEEAKEEKSEELSSEVKALSTQIGKLISLVEKKFLSEEKSEEDGEKKVEEPVAEPKAEEAKEEAPVEEKELEVIKQELIEARKEIAKANEPVMKTLSATYSKEISDNNEAMLGFLQRQIQ